MPKRKKWKRPVLDIPEEDGPVQVPAPVSIPEPEPPPPTPQPRVPSVAIVKVYNRCPHCKSVRHALVSSVTSGTTRKEYRRCKVCLKRFVMIDREATPLTE
jgi:hypothetical protein